jgi:hypothetical protein
MPDSGAIEAAVDGILSAQTDKVAVHRMAATSSTASSSAEAPHKAKPSRPRQRIAEKKLASV